MSNLVNKMSDKMSGNDNSNQEYSQGSQKQGYNQQGGMGDEDFDDDDPDFLNQDRQGGMGDRGMHQQTYGQMGDVEEKQPEGGVKYDSSGNKAGRKTANSKRSQMSKGEMDDSMFDSVKKSHDL